MPQYARPDSDVTQTNWSGGYGVIDEESASDADYITGADDANGTAEYGLSEVTDPTSGADHTVRFRAWQENQTFQRTLTVSLIEGSTVRSSYNGGAAFNLVKGTPTAYDWTLSEAEADNISDYTDLRVRFVSAGDVGTPASSRSYVYVSWAELEVPAAATPDALTGQGVASDVPTVAKPTLAQSVFVFTGQNVASGVPAVDKGALGQVHALTGQNIASDVPTVAMPER